MHPCCAWLSPMGAHQAAGRGAPEPAWSTQAAAGNRLLLMRKGYQDHGIQPSSSSQPGCALQAGKVTAQDSAGTSSCLEVPPALSCLTFVTSPATPEGWTESECAQRARGAEVSFMAV